MLRWVVSVDIPCNRLTDYRDVSPAWQNMRGGLIVCPRAAKAHRGHIHEDYGSPGRESPLGLPLSVQNQNGVHHQGRLAETPVTDHLTEALRPSVAPVRPRPVGDLAGYGTMQV